MLLNVMVKINSYLPVPRSSFRLNWTYSFFVHTFIRKPFTFKYKINFHFTSY